MRLRRLEIVIIAITLMFACFLGGYFTGLKSTVSVIPALPQGELVPLGGDRPQSGGDATDNGGGEAVATDASPGGDATAPGGGAFSQNVSPKGPETADGMPIPGDGKININTATRSELMDLPGIGGVLADRIIEYRNKNGAFAKTDDITKVSGIGVKKYEAMRDLITVGR